MSSAFVFFVCASMCVAVGASAFVQLKILPAREAARKQSKASEVFEAMTLAEDAPEWRIGKADYTSGTRFRVERKLRCESGLSWRTVAYADNLKTIYEARAFIGKEKAKYADANTHYVVVE